MGYFLVVGRCCSGGIYSLTLGGVAKPMKVPNRDGPPGVFTLPSSGHMKTTLWVTIEDVSCMWFGI